MDDSISGKPPRTGKDWFELGYELLRAGRLPGALDAFRQSIKLNPKVAAPWIGLSKVLEANGQQEEARECLKYAIAAEPTHIDAHIKLATAHKNLGHVEEAKSTYHNALKLAPNSEKAYFGLGHLMEELGDPDTAASSYRSALKLNPKYAEALSNLLGLSRTIDVSAEIETANQLLNETENRDKALIGYGLGKAYEQQKSYSEAFDAYASANLARRNVSGAFDREKFDQRIKKMIELFSPEFFAARKGWGNASKRPVFIVGLPRSGTTLTEQIIGSHSGCFGAGELQALTDVATGTPDILRQPEPAWPACAPDLTADHMAILAQNYLDQSSARAPQQALRVVDKQPLNFWHLGFVAMALPNAHIIHCTRDIRDCGLSIFTQNFSTQQNWSTDLADIGYYWKGYKKLMDHWLEASGLKITQVSYEDTVSDLEGQAKHLLNFLDLPWEDDVLNFHENDRAVQTPSRWQVRRPLYQSSKARWRRYETQLQPLIEAIQDQL